MNRNEAIEQTARDALENMKLYVEQYPHMDKGYMLDSRQSLEKALAMPKADAVNHRCDYCGQDYTDQKFCCERRREYLNHHGIYEPKADAERVALLERIDRAIASLGPKTDLLRDIRAYLQGGAA